MEKPRKLNKLKVAIVVILILLFFTITVFGRYIYNSAREAYLVARQFYFSSDILTVNGSNYQYNNWAGVDVYPIEFELRSYNNEISKLDYDLEYTVTCETENTDKIECTVNSHGEGASSTVTGIIYASTNKSNVVVYVKPLVQIQQNETVKVKVTARTEEPYEKEISCEFSLKPEIHAGISYTIEDSVNSEYALLKITNTQDMGLPITLEFDPRELRIDSNDDIYVNKTSQGTTSISGKQYVNKLVFNMEKESTRYVKFYKVDKSQNYTYPGVEETSAITVTTI